MFIINQKFPKFQFFSVKFQSLLEFNATINDVFKTLQKWNHKTVAEIAKEQNNNKQHTSVIYYNVLQLTFESHKTFNHKENK